MGLNFYETRVVNIENGEYRPFMFADLCYSVLKHTLQLDSFFAGRAGGSYLQLLYGVLVL